MSNRKIGFPAHIGNYQMLSFRDDMWKLIKIKYHYNLTMVVYNRFFTGTPRYAQFLNTTALYTITANEK